MLNMIRKLLDSGSSFTLDLLIGGLEGQGRPVWQRELGVHYVDEVGLVVESRVQGFDYVAYSWPTILILRVSISEDKRGPR